MDRLAFVLYLIVLVISPLLFGAVHAYAYSLIFLAIFLATLLLVIQNIGRDLRTGQRFFRLPVTAANPLFLLLLIYLVLQQLPLPAVLVQVLSPETMAIAGRLPFVDTVPSFLALSPQVYPVRMSLVRWLAYGFFFLGLCQVLNSRKRLEIIISTILATAVFVCLYGIFQSYSGDNLIWWFRKFGNDVNGTFINRNHFAGYMTMALLLATAFSGAFARSRRSRSAGGGTNLKMRLRAIFSWEQFAAKRLVTGMAGLVCGLGLVLSGSRGGIIAATAGLFLAGLFFVRRRNLRSQGYFILLLFCLIVAYSISVGIDKTVQRFSYFDVSMEDRNQYTVSMLEMSGDYPLTGIGLGNFTYAYPRYQAIAHQGQYLLYGHNDWVQFLAEAGLVGFVLFLIGATLFLVRYLRQWRARHHPLSVALGIAPLPVLFAMAIHSWSDFNLHIPANFLTMTGIVAIGQAALNLKKRRAGERSLLKYHQLPLRKYGGVVLAITLGTLLWAGTWTGRHFLAEGYCNTVLNLTLNRDLNPPAEDVLQALAWDKENGGYWYKLAQARMRERDRLNNSLTATDQEKRALQAEIIASLEQALQLNPWQAEYALRLGWEYTYKWAEPDYREKWLPAADRAMTRARSFAGPLNPALYRDLGNYWVMRTITLVPASPAWDAAWSRARDLYQQAMALPGSGKKMRAEMASYAWNLYPDQRILDRLGLGKK